VPKVAMRHAAQFVVDQRYQLLKGLLVAGSPPRQELGYEI
jgi:hypothetical protein